MATSDVERKLAAILMDGVTGNSSLMEKFEQATIHTLIVYCEVNSR